MCSAHFPLKSRPATIARFGVKTQQGAQRGPNQQTVREHSRAQHSGGDQTKWRHDLECTSARTLQNSPPSLLFVHPSSNIQYRLSASRIPLPPPHFHRLFSTTSFPLYRPPPRQYKYLHDGPLPPRNHHFPHEVCRPPHYCRRHEALSPPPRHWRHELPPQHR